MSLINTHIASTVHEQKGSSALYAQMIVSDEDNIIKSKAVRWYQQDRSDGSLKGGDFVMSVWEGDLRKAFRLADLENKRALESVTGFDKEEYLRW